MKSFAINFLVFLLIASLATLGWFGFRQLENGQEYITSERTETLPEVVIEDIPQENTLSDEQETGPADLVNLPEVQPDTSELNNEFSKLITDLENLIENQVIMKEGSQGTRVGIVQEFLNVYFDRNDRIDNAYGPGTASRVRDFQRAEGLSADGQAGPNTYRKMIETLR